MKLKKISISLLFVLAFVAQLNAETSSEAADNYKWSLLPLPAFGMAPETGIQYGVAALFSGVPDSMSHTSKNDTGTLSVIYTQKSQLQFNLEVEKYFDNGNWYLFAKPIFDKFISSYWGLGPQTKNAVPETYSYNDFGLTAALLRQVAPQLYLGPYYKLLGYEVTAVEQGGLFDLRQVPGFKNGRASAAGIKFMWDARDKRYSPNSGFILDFKTGASLKLLGATEDFYFAEGDYRTYHTLFSENIIAFNVMAKLAGHGAPLKSIPALGGCYYMRGFFEGRYIDYNYLTFQAEYRFPLFSPWGLRAAVFGGAAQVADRVDYFSTNDVKISYGIGIHWKPFDFMSSPIRCDFAFAGEGPQMYLDLVEAF